MSEDKATYLENDEPTLEWATQQLIWLAQGAGEQMRCQCDDAGFWCWKHRLLYYAERYHDAVNCAREDASSMGPDYPRMIGKTVADAGNAAISPCLSEALGEALVIRFTDGTTLRIDATVNTAALVGTGYETPRGERLRANNLEAHLLPTWFDATTE